jgi:hypothetical protein
MMQEILDRLSIFSEDMLLHYASPNKGLVAEVLQYDAAGLNELTQETLSKYILVLGQYLVMLKHNENSKNVEYMLMSKTLEHELAKKSLSFEFPKTVKTMKDKRSFIMASDEELDSIENKLLVAEAEKVLICGMCDAIEALLNALKKEKSYRSPQGKYDI